MGKDYYAILGLTKYASREEIANSFRKYAILYHPFRENDDLANKTNKFSEICEAYRYVNF